MVKQMGNKMENPKNTEEKILEAARQVFHQKGFNGTRMQEIANLAGINKALLHYYFRNKELLFEKVFNETFAQITSKMKEIFLSDMPLFPKIETFTQFYINFISHHSYIVHFIINSLYEKPEQLREIIVKQDILPEIFLEKIRKQLKDELGIEIDPFHIYVNILALTIFPVVAQPLLQTIFALSDDEMALFFEERKQIVPTFISNALKGYEKSQRTF